MRNHHRLAIAIGVSLVSACGGGGGGGGIPIIPFQSFSAIQPGQTVEASGVSQTTNVTTDPGGTVTSRSVNPVDLSNSSAQLTYGAGPTLTGLSIKTPQSSPSWSGAEISCSPVCDAVNATSAGAAVNPLDPLIGWNYQTFGFWAVDGAPNIAGIISIGAPTPVAGIPTMGTATYNGLSSGIYIDGAGATFGHAADMQAIADFGAPRTVTFSTMNTITSDSVGTIAPMPDLNLSGTLAIAPGANRFDGPVTTAGPTVNLIGSANGRFYGPTAQEIGGVYSLGCCSVDTMIGGFGGKQ